MGEYFGRCERCREHKILQGTHVFSQIDGGRENTVGDSKIPPGTSRGDFHGVCSRGVCFHQDPLQSYMVDHL